MNSTVNYAAHSGHPWSHALNGLALAGVTGALLFAFAWQIYFNEPPCPLCLLQRVAFALAGIGLLLNIRFGASALYYGIVIISALGGIVAAGRQVLMHIAPNDTGYGSPFLGLHFYTWALLAFTGLIAFCGIMLLFERFGPPYGSSRRARFLPGLIVWLFLLVVAGNAVATMLECGFGACPGNPTGYLWLQPRGPGL